MKWPAFLSWGRKSASTYDVLRELFGRNESATGKVVNTATATQVAAVYACLRVLGEGVAQVPLKVMQVSENGAKRTDLRTHPLYDIFTVRANDWQTAYEFMETIVFHAGLAGNAYSFINRTTRGQITELIPFPPGTVTVNRSDSYVLSYEVVGQSGSIQKFPAADIWHVKGPSWDSWMGMESVKLAREAIGLALATEEQQARMQKNGARASGAYSVEGPLQKHQYESLRAWIDAEVAGSANAGKAMILDRGAKWLNTSMSGVDAQTIETRRLQIEEVCRFFRVNPIMVGAESKNTTYASAEQMFLAHLVHTLAPWYTRLEQSINANLLTDRERNNGIYANFVEEGLLRGSATTTKDVLLGYVNGGLMTPNEGRAKLDLNPDPDPASDKLRIPANLVGKIDSAEDPEDDPEEPEDTQDALEEPA